MDLASSTPPPAPAGIPGAPTRRMLGEAGIDSARKRVHECERPVRLRGATKLVNPSTGETRTLYASAQELDGTTWIPCGNRRAAACEPCSRQYQGDAWQLVTTGLALVLRATLVGKAVRAMLQAPLGALLVGIDTRRLHPVCFGVGLALSGVAGVLISMVYQLSPAMGQPYTITALIVITLGGMGNMLGSLVGGVLLGFVETFGTQLTSPSTRMLFAYGTLVLVLLLRPRGVLAR